MKNLSGMKHDRKVLLDKLANRPCEKEKLELIRQIYKLDENITNVEGLIGEIAEELT